MTPLVEKLNAKVMRRVKKSRRQLFEELDRPALKPLPARPYEFADWAKAKVGPHYHVEFRTTSTASPTCCCTSTRRSARRRRRWSFW